MTTDLLAKLDALAEKATEGPLRIGGNETHTLVGSRGELIGEIDFEFGDDADFIVSLVNAYPALRAELLAAREYIEAMESFYDCAPQDLTFRVAREINPSIWRRLVEKFHSYRATRDGDGER